MWLTIAGAFIAASSAIVGIVAGKSPRTTQLILIGLSLTGLLVSVFSSEQESIAKHKEEIEKEHAIDAREIANERLSEMRSVLALVNNTVGDLGTLNQLSGGTKYHVQIAHANSQGGLDAGLRRINAEFKGARNSGMVCVINPGSGSYDLVFGRNLNLAAAEVFKRLANSHHLPPTSNGVTEFAIIRQESATPCLPT